MYPRAAFRHFGPPDDPRMRTSLSRARLRLCLTQQPSPALPEQAHGLSGNPLVSPLPFETARDAPAEPVLPRLSTASGVLAAADIALWALPGRAASLPIDQLLGGDLRIL
jgi:hypothetical protein